MPRKSFDAEVLEFTQAVALLVRRLRSAAGPRELTLSEASALGRLVGDGAGDNR